MTIAAERACFFEAADQDKTAFFYGHQYHLDFYDGTLAAFTAELVQRYGVAQQEKTDDVVMAENAPSVFLCHCSENSEQATNIESWLNLQGIKTWRDRQNLRGGDKWATMIPRVIESGCDYFLVLQSTAMSRRRESYFHGEIKEALKREQKIGLGFRFLIPCRIEVCEKVVGLEGFHCLDLYEAQGHEQLKQSILEDWQKGQALMAGAE